MIKTVIDFKRQITGNTGVLFYFATQSCSVGEALEPKVRNLLIQKYPKLVFRSIDMNVASELSASLNVFTEPTILVFFEGKEFLRKSRHINLAELDMAVCRIYELAFE